VEKLEAMAISMSYSSHWINGFMMAKEEAVAIVKAHIARGEV